MEDTLLAGDQMIVETVSQAFGRTPQRGDLVAFRFPVDRAQIHIKRIAAVPGDRLRIENKQLVLNGDRVKEPYATHKTDYIDAYRDNFPGEPTTAIYPPGEAMLKENVRNGEVVVPEGKYFVLGDNRDGSLDSRYFGFITRDDFVGRPLLIYASSRRDRFLKPLLFSQ